MPEVRQEVMTFWRDDLRASVGARSFPPGCEVFLLSSPRVHIGQVGVEVRYRVDRRASSTT